MAKKYSVKQGRVTTNDTVWNHPIDIGLTPVGDKHYRFMVYTNKGLPKASNRVYTENELIAVADWFARWVKTQHAIPLIQDKSKFHDFVEDTPF